MAARADSGTRDVCKECGGKIVYTRALAPEGHTGWWRGNDQWFHIRERTNYHTVGTEDDRMCFPDEAEDWALMRKRATPLNFCSEQQGDGQMCNRKNREGRKHCGIHDRYVREREAVDDQHRQQLEMSNEFQRLMEELVAQLKGLGLEAEVWPGRYGYGPDGRVMIDGVELLELLEAKEAKSARRVSGSKRGRKEPQGDLSDEPSPV